MRIGYLGPQGTFTEEALHLYMEHHHSEAEIIPFSTIDATLDACRVGNVDFAFVPIENSLGGGVVTTSDYIIDHTGLFIVSELCMPIRHYLWGYGDVPAEINEILSHPQALLQCHKHLQEHYPNVVCTEWSSTAGAAEEVARRKSPSVAAIGGASLGIGYNLKRLTEPIQDVNTNTTRFVLISAHEEDIIESGTKSSLLCQLDGLRPGSLAEGLTVISRRGINLVRIESRPNKNRLGEYVFFLDLLGGVGDSNVRAAFEELEQVSTEFRFLGSYNSISME